MKVERSSAPSRISEGTFKVPVRKILPAIGSAIRDLLVQRGWFSAPKNAGAAALVAALGEVAETLETGRVPEARRRALLDEVPLSRTLTHRSWELPYELPPSMLVGTPKSPVDLSVLDPKKTYLWVLDAEGRFLVAAERQEGVDGKVNHGDMCPAEGGSARGAARAGGELKAADEDGRIVWHLDLSSSFSFNRMDLDVLRDEHLHAVIAYLGASGMDVTDLRPGHNTFDAIYRLAGFGHLAKYYLGIGAPR